MDVNKIKILNSDLDREIVVPLGTQWDFLDRSDAIKQEQQSVLKKVIGSPPNYELSRFSHVANSTGLSELTYQFFFSEQVEGPWENSYLTKFTDNQVRYYSNAFAKSFFKLDFYDSMDPKTQKNYLSVILPTSNSALVEESQCREYFFTFQALGDRPSELQYTNCCGENVEIQGQGGSGGFPATTVRICVRIGGDVRFVRYFVNQAGQLVAQSLLVDLAQGTGQYDITLLGDCSCNSDLPTVDTNSRPLVTPTFFLDHFGKQEGFYLHWYEDKNLLGIETFYMSAKFFDAAKGQYVKFINGKQSFYTNKYRIPNKDYYYIVNLTYGNKTYEIISTQSDNFTSVLEWYEYKNPPLD